MQQKIIKQLPKRTLSNTNYNVSRIGLGCMGMSAFYGAPISDEEGIRLIGIALEHGENFFDTAAIYGDNEILLGKAIKHYGREKFFLATKVPPFQYSQDEDGNYIRIPQAGTPENIKASCQQSLERLQTTYIDLYYQHRIDQNIPIEIQAGAFKELIQQGKVKYYGLSEASEDTIRRAHAVHPVTAVQEEYSLQTRDIETNGVLKACKELNIAVVAYSPLGRGLLTGTLQNKEQLEKTDFRAMLPRYQEDALKQNNERVEKLKQIAESLNLTPGQLALAWLLAQGDNIFPIPGTKREKYLVQNMGGAVDLKPDVVKQISQLFPINSTAGLRYPEEFMDSCNSTTKQL